MFRTFCFVMLAALLLPDLQAQSGAALQRPLESVYGQWRQSMLRKDYTLWKRTTAYARQVETRNVVVSKKEKFPASVFALALRPPALTGMRALSVKAKGPTATAVYFGKVDFAVGGQVPKESLLVLRYLKEGNQWKFYRMAVMSQLPPDVLRDIRAKRYDFLKEPEFQPSGRGPAIQKECPKPDYVTDVHLISLGFDTEVKINGISDHVMSDYYGTQLVIGGLKRGKNSISIKGRSLGRSESGQKNLKVTVHVKTGRRDRPAVKVFEFKPDPAKGPFEYRGTFTVDANALKR